MRLICAGLIATLGCSGGPGGPDPDDVDAGVSGDGGGLDTTLIVELEPNPELPGAFDGSFSPTMEAAAVDIADFRAVSDGAVSDNQRIAELQVDFASEQTVRFEDIPVGRYTRTRGRIDRYQLSGTLVIDASTFDWEIDDSPPGGIDISSDFTAIELGGGDEATVSLEIDLERVFNAVAWETVPPDGELLRIDASSPQIDGVRGKIREAFEEDPSDE